MYTRGFLLLFLSVSVLSSPLLLLDDAQPQLGASLTLLGNSACPPLPWFGSLPSTNVTQAGNVAIASQTTYVSATQTGIVPATNSSASIVAPLSIGGPQPTCTKLKTEILNKYKPSIYNFPPTLLSPGKNRAFGFSFVRNGGQLLHIVIAGRPQSSPDQPGSYFPVANEAFVHGNNANVVEFYIYEPAWVHIQLRVSPGAGAFSYHLELLQIDFVA